jgi:RHS repeat-associated protein
MLREFGLINMNGRVYDPLTSRFLSPDNYVQNPNNPQNYNRYAYALNNPLKYVDPDGEFFWIPFIIGAAIGGYVGYKIADAKEYDFNDWQMYGYMLGGAVIGGLSGALGAEIAAAGGFMANTTSMIMSSYTFSVGMAALSNGMIHPSVNFGFGSYDFETGELNYLFGGDNKWYENLGYFLGAMGNLNDINNLINQTNARLYTQVKNLDGSKDIISHTGIVDDATGDNLMSFGPDDNKIGAGGFKDQIGSAKPLGGYKKFGLAVRKGTPNYPVYPSLSKSTTLVVNKYLFSELRKVSKFIPYQGLTTNCVNMSSISLWLNGIPNIGIHPFLLHYSIVAYNSGFNPYVFNLLTIIP